MSYPFSVATVPIPLRVALYLLVADDPATVDHHQLTTGIDGPRHPVRLVLGV